MTSEIYIICHGETDFNKYGRIDDSHNLNKTGKLQATITGKYLKEYRTESGDFDLILCSELTRAKDTAILITQEINYEKEKILYFSELNERNLGILLKYDKEKEDFYTEYQSIVNEYTIIKDPIKQLEMRDKIIFPDKYKIESIKTFRKRIKNFLRKLFDMKQKKILIISHDLTIREINYQLSGVRNLDAHGNNTNCHITYYKNKKIIMPPSNKHLDIYILS